MAIKSPTKIQSTFIHKTTITNRAKQLIKQNPGIYTGNLFNRLQIEIKSINSNDIKNVFFQLCNEGYDFKGELIYSPNTINPLYKKLKRFTILKPNLNEMDFEIFIAVIKLKDNASFPNITRRVISINTSYSEREVKYEIGFLFKEGFILAKPSEKEPKLYVNWKNVDEGSNQSNILSLLFMVNFMALTFLDILGGYMTSRMIRLEDSSQLKTPNKYTSMYIRIMDLTHV